MSFLELNPGLYLTSDDIRFVNLSKGRVNKYKRYTWISGMTETAVEFLGVIMTNETVQEGVFLISFWLTRLHLPKSVAV
jgi:hypothetical protein